MSDSDASDKELTPKELQELQRRRRRNQKKKLSKKANRHKEGADSGNATLDDDEEAAVVHIDGEEAPAAAAADTPPEGGELKAEVEFVGEQLKLDERDPYYFYFSKVFDAFKVKTEEEVKAERIAARERAPVGDMDTVNKAAISERILQEEMRQRRKEAEEAGEAQPMSRKKTRLTMQPSMAELKASTPRPDVVEWADVTSKDPFLLVKMKAYRNTVPVPRHWNAKRKFLAGKRGFERAPFELPEFIKRTGIAEIRESMWEKQEQQSLKSQMRERTRPKLGRIDIDYQKLHDAFFKWQTKPAMTRMGELYYEGKELEAQMRDKKPGQLSDELRIALGMPVGPNATKFPPPWLIAMQRYGPPPSYPNLKIGGLNSPIPDGCAFGYHAGGWGKPPVDELGKPLYGDVFGIDAPRVDEVEDESRIDRRHWGEIGSDGEAEEEESDEEEEEEPQRQEGAAAHAAPPESGFTTPAVTEGFATPSGITTIPGMETPEIELRKRRTADDSLAGSDTPAGPLYTVLAEKRLDRVAGQFMGSSHVYDLSKRGGIEVSLDPEQIEQMGNQVGMQRIYEEQLRKESSKSRGDPGEDFSDLVAEHSKTQGRKRKTVEQKPSKGSDSTTDKKKDHKHFKF